MLACPVKTHNVNYTNMEDAHHLKRAVKLDYSDTYRGNEELEDVLEDQLDSLHQEQYRIERNKTLEIVEVKKDAEMILNLKDIVNNKSVDTLELYNKYSNISPGNHDNETTEHSVGVKQEVGKTMRRLQMERDRFSAKNHFNITIPRLRRSSSLFPVTSAVPATAPVETTIQLVNQSKSRGIKHQSLFERLQETRPRSVPARGHSDTASDRYSRSAGFARSRRQLREMSELEQFYSEPPRISGWELRRRLLSSLREYNKQLQVRVNSFVEELAKFNMRQKQSKYMFEN